MLTASASTRVIRCGAIGGMRFSCLCGRHFWAMKAPRAIPLRLARSCLGWWECILAGWLLKSDAKLRRLDTAAAVALLGLLIWAVAGRLSGYLIQTRLYLGFFPALAMLAGGGYRVICPHSPARRAPGQGCRSVGGARPGFEYGADRVGYALQGRTGGSGWGALPAAIPGRQPGLVCPGGFCHPPAACLASAS